MNKYLFVFATITLVSCGNAPSSSLTQSEINSIVQDSSLVNSIASSLDLDSSTVDSIIQSVAPSSDELGSSQTVLIPEIIPGEGMQIEAFGNSTLLVDASGQLFGWGRNNTGQLGDGTTIDRYEPTPIIISDLDEGESIIGLAGGNEISPATGHVLALTSEGRVFSWGDNTWGQLGNGTTQQQLTPLAIEFSELEEYESIALIEANSNNSYAVTNFGRLFAWGYGSTGRLGAGNTDYQVTTPRLILFEDFFEFGHPNQDEKIVQISAGIQHVVILTNYARVFAWGENTYGQIGNYSLNRATTPQLISVTYSWAGLSITDGNSGEYVTNVFAGGYSTFVTSNFDQSFSWGHNGSGRLGGGENDTSSARAGSIVMVRPELEPLEKYTKIQPGWAHTVAFTNAGSLFSWGNNALGQLGNPNLVSGLTDPNFPPVREPIRIPVQLNLDDQERIVNLSTGFYHSIGITSSGRLFGWGPNQYGQLGVDASIVRYLEPTFL